LRVALIGDKFVETHSGVRRYGYELLRGLRRKGYLVKAFPRGRVIETVNIPYKLLLHNLLLLGRVSKWKFDILHATAPVDGVFMMLRWEVKKVVTYHDLLPLLGKNTGTKFRVKAVAPFFYRVGKYVNKIIAVSTQTKDEVINYLKVPSEKVTVINLGVDERFKPLKKKEDRDHYVIGYLGAFTPRKRVNLLIYGFYILRKLYPGLKAKLVICGEKKWDYPKLIRLAEFLGLSRYIEFKGRIPEEEIVATYNSFDVFVWPSEWEGFGLPILEAQRCGVPVIIMKDAHIPDEVSKYCIKASSSKDLAYKIYELLTNVGLRRDVIKKAMDYSKRFTWERTIEETIKVYEEVVHEQ